MHYSWYHPGKSRLGPDFLLTFHGYRVVPSLNIPGSRDVKLFKKMTNNIRWVSLLAMTHFILIGSSPIDFFRTRSNQNTKKKNGKLDLRKPTFFNVKSELFQMEKKPDVIYTTNVIRMQMFSLTGPKCHSDLLTRRKKFTGWSKSLTALK